jgi:hypothetical protein
MNGRLFAGIILVTIGLDLLAEWYYFKSGDDLVGEIGNYLRSVNGRFEQYYAARNRPDGGAASGTEGKSFRGNGGMDRSNGGGGEVAD